MAHNEKSVLVISPNVAFAETMRGVFEADGDRKYATESASFSGLNGQASKLVARHDVIIFEVDPDDTAEVEAIAVARAEHGSNAVFVALTGNDVTVAKARRLREIGVDEVLPISITGPELTSVIDETLKRRVVPQQMVPAWVKPEGMVIPVMQARGEIGSTTVAVNLACQLLGRSSMFHRAAKKKVALLDFDLQFGNANVYLDLEDNGGFLEMMDTQEEPDLNYITGVMQTHASGLRLLSAPASVAPLTSLTAGRVIKLLDELRSECDYVIVDLPRALVDWIAPVLDRATRLVMVTDTSVPCIRQAKRILDFIKEDHFSLPVEIVVNREKRPLLRSEQTREAEKLLQTKLRHWLPDNQKLSRTAIDLGRPVALLRPGADLSKAFERLATALSSEPHIQTSKPI